jgi:uncharacterized membrane protein
MSGRLILGVLFVGAGLLHFVLTPIYVGIMPSYLPEPRLLVQFSGLCEILGGLGLLEPRTRVVAAWGLMALLVAVMPANLNMALHPEQFPRVSGWVLWLRVPLQIPLILWAWRFTRELH